MLDSARPSTFWTGASFSALLLVSTFVAGAAACGGDEGTGSSSSGGGPLMPPTPAPFGLDVRPTNATCVVPPRPRTDASARFEPAFPGLTFSGTAYITQAPGDRDRFYVIERGGIVRTFLRGATSNAQVSDFLRVDVNSDGEGGLLGMAFAPDFATSRVLYLSYTRRAAVPGYSSNQRSVIARVRSTNGTTTDGPPVIVYEVGQPYSNHDGGGIQFGPDGYLYFGLGDGGSGDDPLLAGQDLTTPLGKMLRFDVSNVNATTVAIPADNPFVGMPNARTCTNYDPPASPTPGPGPCNEIWAYGFRNPWRWSFDRESGEMWVGDVGQNRWEEVDARVQKGGNYGWNICEGNHERGSTTRLCTVPGFIAPLLEHNRTEARSITGGYVYRGTEVPSMRGKYVYGDYATGNVWTVVYDASGAPTPTLLGNVGMGQLTSFGEGNDGELYAVTGDTIQKLVPTSMDAPDTFPAVLSSTGCTQPGDATKPADGLVPYDLISPLWSDGADKLRYMALPDGKTIRVNDNGDWDFPIGTVLVKTFTRGERRLETRLFMRHDDGGWGGYSYEWNAEGTDATLLPASKVAMYPTGDTWTFPSRTQCLQCHTVAAGGALGPETINMNRDAIYASTNRISPQLDTLQHIGMFSAPLPADRPRFVAPSDTTAAIDLRARAYLHTNCAHCHRPEGGGQGSLDLRHQTPLERAGLCNAMNTQGAVGVADLLLVPGSPESSILSLRMRATDSKRMPTIAVSQTDPLGVEIVDGFIRSIQTCP